MGKDVIIALDFDSKEKTIAFLDHFTGEKPFVKIGMELFYAEGPAIVREIRFDTVCACGPMPMLKALCAKTDKPGQISLEARMGCGFGACMGCTIDTVNGPKRVCREGPVFRRDEIKW